MDALTDWLLFVMAIVVAVLLFVLMGAVQNSPRVQLDQGSHDVTF